MGDAHCDPEAGTPGFGAVSYNNHDGGGDGDGGGGGDGSGGDDGGGDGGGDYGDGGKVPLLEH